MANEDVGKLYPIAKAVLTPVFRAAWKFDLQGLDHVPAAGPAILCPNHTSVLDSFFVPALLPRRVTYVGKAEYMDDWKTRRLFPALGMIPIDREGGDAGERALATAQRILESGELFGIYPEGTRSRDGRLYRGHTGPARLALRTGAPIIPIGISGAREVMPPDAKFPKLRLPVTIRFGRPIDVTRYADRADDRLVLRQIIDEVMYEIRGLSGQEYVDSYATKKKQAEAPAAPVPVPEAPAAAAEPVPALSAADALGAARARRGSGTNGNGVNGGTARSGQDGDGGDDEPFASVSTST
ncbi:MAG: 1-acyl-sn-glycerol-3-phosphate acyltransferase, partial [Acidimicrobiales bacterium]|nr:1-acyl-sn-glycerol-3-phosphate acyltransferase [Acidimicrobiales bacterium]